MALRLIFGGTEPAPDELDRQGLEVIYRPPRPAWVRANLVVSLDGAVELGGTSGALGGADDRVVFATLRALADVVLVGSGTVRAEDYGPVRVAEPATARRVARGQAARPPVAVLSNRADLDPGARLFHEGAGDEAASRPLILTCEAAPARARAALAPVADVVSCGDSAVDLTVALDELRARGLSGVLCEGGPTIVTRLLGSGLVDELCLTQAPVVAGPGHALLVAGEPLAASVATRLVQLVAGDGLLFGRYEVLAGGAT